MPRLIATPTTRRAAQARPATKTPPAAPEIEAEIRRNGRGGWEIGQPGTEPGRGLGNYPDARAAYAIARYNFDQATIRIVIPSDF